MNKTAPKVLVVFGTRPEVIKLAPLISKIEASGKNSDFLYVSTSQHTELLEDQFDFWKFTPDIVLSTTQNGGSLTRLLAFCLLQLQDIIDQYPSLEYVIVQGDTNTALACANLAFLNQKKLVHIEAGLRTYDLQSPFPEEYNRVTVSKVAFFHFVPSVKNRTNLLNEGIKESQIMVTGNTVIDALHMSLGKSGTPVSAEPKNNVIITTHRRENAVHFAKLIQTIERLKANFPELNFTWITHPGYSTENMRLLETIQGVNIVSHLPYIAFISQYKTARFVITDSGGITEEASQIGIPVVVFRKVNDRSEPLEMGHAMLVSREEDEILAFFKKHLHYRPSKEDYFGKGTASQLIFDWISEKISPVGKSISPKKVNTVIIGGGPAGTGIILKSMKNGTFEQFAEKGLALIESSGNLVSGSITQYQVNSDTLSDVFLECLDNETEHYLNLKKLVSPVLKIRKYQGKAIPLPLLKPFFAKLGEVLAKSLQSHCACELYLNTKATKIVRLGNHSFRIELNGGKHLICNNVILATGGNPLESFKPGFSFAGEVNLSDFTFKSILSDDLLCGNMDHSLPDSPKVVILGGNHSAFSVADHLLKANKFTFSRNAIRIWSKTEPKLYFPFAEDARLNGYTDFDENDICPLTKRVFRLAGLRMDGRNLYMDLLNKKENRVSVNCYGKEKEALLKDLANADLIVHAFGYQFNMIPFTDEQNVPINLFHEANHWVNEHCQMQDKDGNPISGLYATGLGTGFIPSGNLGGEASFKGQTNGLWYYQNVTAELIMNSIAERIQEPIAEKE